MQMLSSTVKFKRYHSITWPCLLLILIGSISLYSCKKDKPEPQPQPETTYTLSVTPATIQAPATAGQITNVTIESNAPWTVTLPAGTDWIDLNKISGTGTDAIQVKVSKENAASAARSAVITVALVNGKAPAKTITVTQDFAASNAVSIAWKKVIGGNGNDYGYSLIKTTDGGYLLSGRTSSSSSGDIPASNGGIDMLVMKLDATGSITWQKTFGGNGDEYSVSAAATPDGGYVLTGYTTSSNNGDVGLNHGATDFWIVKINETGILQWQKTLGGTGDDRPNAVTITSEGRIAVAGYTTSTNGDVGPSHGYEDFWVMLLDNGNGNFLWKKTFGGNGSEVAKAIAPAPDGGVYVGGSAISSNNGDVGTGKGNADFWVLHLDRSLSIVWKNNLGGTNIEELNALVPGPDNSLIAAGSTKSSGTGDVGTTKGGEDMWVVQLNAGTGAMNWQKSFGGTGIDVAKGLLVKADGSILIASYTYSENSGDVGASHGSGDFWILKLNASGNLTWKQLLGGDNEEQALAIAASNDNGFVVAGYTLSNNNGDVGASHGNSDIWILKSKEE